MRYLPPPFPFFRDPHLLSLPLCKNSRWGCRSAGGAIAQPGICVKVVQYSSIWCPISLGFHPLVRQRDIPVALHAALHPGYGCGFEHLHTLSPWGCPVTLPSRVTRRLPYHSLPQGDRETTGVQSTRRITAGGRSPTGNVGTRNRCPASRRLSRRLTHQSRFPRQFQHRTDKPVGQAVARVL